MFFSMPNTMSDPIREIGFFVTVCRRSICGGCVLLGVLWLFVGPLVALGSVWGASANAIAAVRSAPLGASRAGNRSGVLAADVTIERVDVGLAGKVRLGHWTPIKVYLPGPVTNDVPWRVTVRCVDGEDVSASYPLHLHRDGGPSQHEAPAVAGGETSTAVYVGRFRLGRARSSLIVTVCDATGQVIVARELEPQSSDSAWTAISPTARQILFVGKSVRELLPERRNSDRELVLSEIALADLPTDPYALAGVDTLVMGLESSEDVAQLSSAQVVAVSEWTRGGGRLVLLAAPPVGEAFLPGSSLAAWGDCRDVQQHDLKSAGALESFVESRLPLLSEAQASYPLVTWNFQRSSPRLAQGDLVLVGQYGWGWGTVLYCGLNIWELPLANWEGRPQLLEKIVFRPRELVPSNLTVNARIMNNGYRDLAGQLRVPLEEFASVGFIPFTAIAALIVVYLLLIGPGDYLVLRGLGRRMHWTWVTFPLTAAAFGLVAWSLNSWAKPEGMRTNLVELLDVDIGRTDQRGQAPARGRVWGAVYSPLAQQMDVTLQVQNEALNSLTRQEISWMGQPGNGLGGMETNTPSLVAAPGYEHLAIDSKTSSASSDEPLVQQLSLAGFPTGVASVRTLRGDWEGVLPLAGASRLLRGKKLDRLEGQFVNPLPVAIRRPRLYYEDSVFFVDRDLAPQDSMDVFSEAKERAIKISITGRSGTVAEGVKAQAWNPQDTNIPKILELMMLHEQAGGVVYSGLTNHYFAGLELVDQLLPHQAVLIGEVDWPVGQLEINGDRVKTERHVTLVRLLIPVDVEK
jgi:hypothetical protein